MARLRRSLWRQSQPKTPTSSSSMFRLVTTSIPSPTTRLRLCSTLAINRMWEVLTTASFALWKMRVADQCSSTENDTQLVLHESKAGCGGSRAALHFKQDELIQITDMKIQLVPLLIINGGSAGVSEACFTMKKGCSSSKSLTSEVWTKITALRRLACLVPNKASAWKLARSLHRLARRQRSADGGEAHHQS